MSKRSHERRHYFPALARNARATGIFGFVVLFAGWTIGVFSLGFYFGSQSARSERVTVAW